MVTPAAHVKAMKGHLLLEKMQCRIIRNLLWFEEAPLVINPDAVHPHLLLETDFVEYLVVGGCLRRSLPNFISIFYQEQRARGCRLFILLEGAPALLGLL